MSTVKKIICDGQLCKAQIEIAEEEQAMDYEGWGQVYGHDEHYCPDGCWSDYCEYHDVDPKTGKDI